MRRHNVSSKVTRTKGKIKYLPKFGPRLPRYRSALEAISKTAIFLGNIDLSRNVADIWSFYCKSQRDYGLEYTVKLLKAIHNEAIRYATDTPCEVSTPTWVKRMKNNSTGKPDGIVYFLKNFVPLLKSKNVLEVRMALSLLKCYEAIVLPIKENIDSIITDSNGPNNYALIKEDFVKFLATSPDWRVYKEEFKKQVVNYRMDKVDFHYTTKKGINGPSAGTAGLQSMALKDDLVKLLSSVSDTFYEEKYEPLIRANQIFYQNRSSDISGIPKKPSLLANRIGRLAFVSDKGGKTRTVAIGNYWVQNALYPLHRVCFNTLRCSKCDGTFDQISQFENVRYASSYGPVWSFDLTTATDRIPLVLDIDVLKSLDRQLGQTWGEILTDYPFEYQGNIVKYKVGQPMGFYSSWALLALGHHAIILYCAHKCGLKSFYDYAVIGDDVAIWNSQVANEYKLMMEYLDVPISKQKSFVPQKPEGPCSAEFAKRVSHNGIEITGISPDIAIECWKSYVLFPEFIAWLAIHNFSEATSARFSKVVDLMNLSADQISDCLSLIHINGILGQPRVNLLGLNLDLIPKEIQNLKTVKLAERRLSLLMSRCSGELTYLFKEKVSHERAQLENLQMADSPEDLVFKRILLSSIRRYDNLREEFLTETFEFKSDIQLIDEYSYINIDGVAPTGVRFKTELYDGISTGSRYLLNSLKTIEYLPPVKLKDLIDGLTSHDKTFVRRGRYIRDLLRHIMKEKTDFDQYLTDIEQFTVRMNTLRIMTDTICCNRSR